MTVSVKLTIREDMLDLITAAIGTGGKLAVYSGTRPTNVDTALSGNTKLVEFTLNNPACAGAASPGVIVLSVSPPISATAVAGGTATFYRLTDSSGVVVQDGAVGTSGADLNLSSTTIVSGEVVSIVSGNLAALAG